MTALLLVLLTPLALWGLGDIYCWYRLARKPEIDWTASVLNWWALKWVWASQTKIMVEKLPFLSRDLSETFGVKPDDGKVS